MRLKKNDQIYAMKVVKKELVHDDEVSAGPPESRVVILGAVSGKIPKLCPTWLYHFMFLPVGHRAPSSPTLTF